jgi:hypothetical protein
MYLYVYMMFASDSVPCVQGTPENETYIYIYIYIYIYMYMCTHVHTYIQIHQAGYIDEAKKHEMLARDAAPWVEDRCEYETQGVCVCVFVRMKVWAICFVCEGMRV